MNNLKLKTEGQLRAFNQWLVALPRTVKREMLLVADGVMLPLLLYLAYAIRLGVLQPYIGTWVLFWLVSLITLPLLYMAGFYRAVVRFIGSEMAWTILVCTSIATLAMTAVLYMARIDSVPRSVLIIFWALAMLYLGGSRFLARRYLLWSLYGRVDHIPVAIYGAGDCGLQLAFGLLQTSAYVPYLFIDDNPRLQGSLIQGIRVVGRKNLERALSRHGIQTVLLAMPSLSRWRRRKILAELETLGVRVKRVPDLSEVVAGRTRIEDVHDVDIMDLLGREPVPPDTILLRASVYGRSVMVTGAGGSIGSELCRQIVAQEPSCLVLFERNEYSLYALERELRHWLRAHDRQTRLVKVLGSVVRRGHVESICRAHEVKTVFHAAAYKHVPIVEDNPAAGVGNNILGTLHAALAAEAAGVERFVLVSTDKAVRPTNVMGATKRFAELVLQAMAARGSDTIFTMVRFGNVLDSSGSVVPLFRKQILAGGPVTLTHQHITRYFMTIPEAAQLVIQAGAMAHGGEVFVLNMGEPIEIHSLACSMIRLMGFSVRDDDNPDGDIEIRITGLRPGEKLYEELLIGKNSSGTHHPMVMQSHEIYLPWTTIAAAVAALRTALQQDDVPTLLGLLREYVNGYQPASASGKVVLLSKEQKRA